MQSLHHRLKSREKKKFSTKGCKIQTLVEKSPKISDKRLLDYANVFTCLEKILAGQKKVLDILENLLEYCNHAEWQNDLGKWTIIVGINVGRRINESTCVNENIMRKYYLELSVFVANSVGIISGASMSVKTTVVN